MDSGDGDDRVRAVADRADELPDDMARSDRGIDACADLRNGEGRHPDRLEDRRGRLDALESDGGGQRPGPPGEPRWHRRVSGIRHRRGRGHERAKRSNDDRSRKWAGRCLYKVCAAYAPTWRAVKHEIAAS